MIHYSCDRCKRVLDPQEDLRYVVRLEVYAAMEPIDEDDVEDDRDNLLEIHEILERSEADGSELVGPDVYQKRRFDLCPACYRKFIKNPLSAEPVAHFNFSSN